MGEDKLANLDLVISGAEGDVAQRQRLSQACALHDVYYTGTGTATEAGSGK